MWHKMRLPGLRFSEYFQDQNHRHNIDEGDKRVQWASETSNMTDRLNEPIDSDERIWRDATVLSPDDTKDAKIHVTLRLDANVYRAILAEKKAKRDRTITATIERLLSEGLQKRDDARDSIRAILRNIAAHSVAQDAVLEMLARYVKPRSAKDKQLVELFKKQSSEPGGIKQLFLEEHGPSATDSAAGQNLISMLMQPAALKGSKRTHEDAPATPKKRRAPNAR